MAVNYVQVPPQGTGLKIDTSELTSGANTVERQNICIADAATASSVAAVKAASTAAAAADPALVVSVSPNSPAVIQAVAGTALAADVTNSELRVSNYVKSAAAGDTALTLGQAAMAASLPVTIANNQGAIGSAVIQAVAGTALAADVTNSELRVSTYVKSAAAGDTALTLGNTTAAASLPVTVASDQAFTQGVAAGAAGTKSVVMGAIYNSTQPTLTNGQGASEQVDSAGSLYANNEGRKATYAAGANFNPGTGATTDIATLYGSGTKTVRVLRVGISGSASTAAAIQDVLVQVRSTAASGGTATTLAVVPYDSADAAGTAVAKVWTAAPTAGANVGSIAAAKLDLPISATGSTSQNQLIFDFGNRPGRAVVLRGTAQGLALTYNGATPANASSVDVWFEWTEE